MKKSKDKQKILTNNQHWWWKKISEVLTYSSTKRNKSCIAVDIVLKIEPYNRKRVNFCKSSLTHWLIRIFYYMFVTKFHSYVRELNDLWKNKYVYETCLLKILCKTLHINIFSYFEREFSLAPPTYSDHFISFNISL